MNIMFAAMLGGWEIILILAVVLILFGARKVPELAKGLGQGIKEFKKATREVQDEIANAVDEEPARPPQKRPALSGTQAQQAQQAQPSPDAQPPAKDSSNQQS
jgi:sec-independent protein translocase protein TatA